MSLQEIQWLFAHYNKMHSGEQTSDGGNKILSSSEVDDLKDLIAKHG